MRKLNDPDTTSGAWFEPKRYGYGAGLPITWQGWVSLGIFISLTVFPSLAIPFLHRPPRRYAGLAVILNDLAVTAIFVWICKSRTKGGWRWRWGDPD
ncbi:hypothetical protein AA101099_1627 [Neoasaia chiangmaiensis NBRC 101099]|uniref:Uncharacterized protein n=1 Tax=Neoasaia chiangmaiensis TaxID=320497 RepID=A0A1U9KRN1_9PROT|nr:hypothetical protein [Neoasaia chiangmaiensis]AQS88392.1 hypothetical protein A0U93_11070 [Neoasaia chiangmaiensis]GBR39365.1 hypothetical protein AA101099_1627 [Neoasaia chiangmaiensis NBRC 101099]GEN14544.1 hypothetical protein NCH01_09750 [Neoasaia chiangmaiensis]